MDSDEIWHQTSMEKTVKVSPCGLEVLGHPRQVVGQRVEHPVEPGV